jgi:hypothetical protein
MTVLLGLIGPRQAARDGVAQRGMESTIEKTQHKEYSLIVTIKSGVPDVFLG